MVTGFVRAGVTSETKIQIFLINRDIFFQKWPRFTSKTVIDSAETRPCISESSFKRNLGKRNTMLREYPVGNGNLEFTVSRPGLDHRCSSSNSVDQVDSQGCVTDSQSWRLLYSVG